MPPTSPSTEGQLVLAYTRVAYSRWPDKATRDSAWPGDNAPNEVLPQDIRETIQKIQAIKQENQDLENYDDICLDVVEDLLLSRTQR